MPHNHKYPKVKKIAIANRKWIDNEIELAPRWCAVDLRDGNQALPNPLGIKQKLEYFSLLNSIGFKEIEIGFPSASMEEYNFCRYLINNNLIPNDLTISVLSPCRIPLIKRTLESLEGCEQASIHIYIASSLLHMKYVLKKTKEEVIKTACECVQFILDNKKDGWGLEFSPEEFTDTDLDFSLELCNKVTALWQGQCDDEIILNLPATVERRQVTDYADMIEVFKGKLIDKKNNVAISLHAHNDMGCGVASTQLALKAGANRVEGTLFGHGERSGNVDLVTIAMNLDYFGIDTGLDFSNLISISETVTRLTGIEQHCRHPYVGALVFSAFSGSHQDAIHKALVNQEELKGAFDGWKVPYLHVDPKTIGREFEKFIRINSQSGKGGLKHILMLEHQINLPDEILLFFIKKVQEYSEKVAREISSQEIWELFTREFLEEKCLLLKSYLPFPDKNNPLDVFGQALLNYQDKEYKLTGKGNGPIAAFTNIVKQIEGIPFFNIEWYKEDSLEKTAEAKAISYIAVRNKKEELFYGIAIHTNTVQAACLALVSAVNNMLTELKK